MSRRRFACFVLGIWLGCELSLAWVALANSWTADRALAPVTAAARYLQPAPALSLALRHQAVEQTRALLEEWGLAQIALGGFLLLYLVFFTEARQIVLALAVFMLALSLGERIFLTPEIVALGRMLDFVRAGVPMAEQSSLSVFGDVYLGVEALKWAAGLALAGQLMRRTRIRSGHVHGQVDTIDKANRGHIDR
jgi:hypothetical protein